MTAKKAIHLPIPRMGYSFRVDNGAFKDRVLGILNFPQGKTITFYYKYEVLLPFMLGGLHYVREDLRGQLRNEHKIETKETQTS